MSKLKINLLAEQKLQEFENMEVLNVSKDWETNLNIKLQYVKPTLNLSLKYSLILAFLLVFNGAFILISVMKNQENNSDRSQDLKVITNEILISQNN